MNKDKSEGDLMCSSRVNSYYSVKQLQFVVVDCCESQVQSRFFFKCKAINELIVWCTVLAGLF